MPNFHIAGSWILRLILYLEENKMSKRVLFTCGLNLVLLFGLVVLSWAVVQPRLMMAIPGVQRPIKHHPNKAWAFEITHWDFESANG